MTTERIKQPGGCAEYADRLVDLSDGELTAEERLTVEAHLETCSSCRAELRRLDVSLAALKSAIVEHVPTTVRRRPISGHGIALLSAACGIAAAILLAAVVVWSLKAPTTGRGELARSSRPSQRPAAIDASGQNTQTTDRVVSKEDALRRIALIEQEARLQMSLDLLPSGPTFAEERAANQRLLNAFRQATAERDNHSKNSFGAGTL
jgi:anti-sigma factor RsiW